MNKLTNMMAITFLTSMLCVLSLPSYGHNQTRSKHEFAMLQLAQADTGINRNQAAKIAKAHHGGKVLSVNKKGSNGTYRVKLLQKSGRVKIVSVSSDGKIR